MTNEQYLVLFTSLVMQSIHHPNICMKFLKEVEKQYKLSKKNWKDSEGLLTIGAKMQEYILDNLKDFIIDSNLNNKPY